jgi:hypothetical protein
MDFKESSNTSVKLQLNENKQTNALNFAKIFHVSPKIMLGKARDTGSLAKLAAIPLMVTIQFALNKDLLLEKEKGKYYFAFDTKELLKGDMAQRFNAYNTALDANFMQIDEVRYRENLEPLGLDWIRLGLQDVLYNHKTKQVYTPNTGRNQNITEIPRPLAESLQLRANPNHDPNTGNFTGGKGGDRAGTRKNSKTRKTKYSRRGSFKTAIKIGRDWIY